MRVWLGLLGTILCACALAQPVRLMPIAYDAERDAYYVADELVVGLEPSAPAALASEVMRWVSLTREPVSPLGASVLRLDRAHGRREHTRTPADAAWRALCGAQLPRVRVQRPDA
jgi:hypothetical protein